MKQMINQEMPPPIMMENMNNPKGENYDNKFNKNSKNNINKNKFKSKLNNNNNINIININQSKNKIFSNNNINNNRKPSIKNKNQHTKRKNSTPKIKENKISDLNSQKEIDIIKDKDININKENQIKISQNISEIKPEESKSNINKSIETNTSKMDKTDEKEKSISYQIGYLSQLKRNQQKHIKNLEEKEIQRKNLSKLKINKKFEEPNEVKLGRIYTTLGQKKSVKYKTGSVHRGKIDNIKNIIQINNNMFNNMKGINNNNQNNIVNNNNVNNNHDNNELNLENLLQKQMEFDNKIKEIKEFLKK
jgi:hypothetical protein